MTKILDQNSGLTLVNYKEPLLPIPEAIGFGYYGAILMTLDGDKMQCHVCGGLFREVGTHARQAHTMLVTEYKEAYKLAKQTSLISETIREERKTRSITYFTKMTPEQKRELRAKAMKGYLKWKATNPTASNFTIQLETKNKRGTCPDQLIAKIQEIAKKIGHTPSKNEFIVETGTQRFVHLIFTTFGSWNEAVKRAGLKPNKKYQQPEGFIKQTYSDEELLDALSLYWKEHDAIPTEADCRRKLIPNGDIYRRRFGGLPNARRMAGIV